MQQVQVEAVESAGPAADVAVALRDRLERRMAEGHAGPAGVLGEGHCHQGFESTLAVFFPGEGEHQPFRHRHLAEHAVVPELAAIRGRAQAITPFAAGPHVHLHVSGGTVLRSPPVDGVMRIGPQSKQQLARGVEHPRDHQFVAERGSGVRCSRHGRARCWIDKKGWHRAPPGCVEDLPGSAGVGLVEIGDDDFLHLHHGLHGAIRLLAIGIAEVTAKRRGHHLPRQAESVLEPSAFRFLAAVGGQLVPEIVDLFLGLDADEEGDGFVELVGRATVQGMEFLPLELETRHEIIDGFDLGIGKYRFVEGDGLGDIVVEPEEWRDRSHKDVLAGWEHHPTASGDEGSGRLLAVDHPRRSKLVDQHAEAFGPEGLFQRHGHGAVFGQRLEHAFRFRRRVDAERDGKALHLLLILGRCIRSHQHHAADHQPRMHDLAAPFGRHMLGCRRSFVRQHQFDRAAQSFLVELEGGFAIALEEQIRIDLHGRLPVDD